MLTPGESDRQRPGASGDGHDDRNHRLLLLGSGAREGPVRRQRRLGRPHRVCRIVSAQTVLRRRRAARSMNAGPSSVARTFTGPCRISPRRNDRGLRDAARMPFVETQGTAAMPRKPWFRPRAAHTSSGPLPFVRYGAAARSTVCLSPPMGQNRGRCSRPWSCASARRATARIGTVLRFRLSRSRSMRSANEQRAA